MPADGRYSGPLRSPYHSGIPGAGSQFDGFATAQSPEQYMNAPTTIGSYGMDSYRPYSRDIASEQYFDVSPLLNVNDPVSLHFLVQKSIADAKGLRVLSYQELDEALKESKVLHSRRRDVENKLQMETKMRDAAAALHKLHGGSNHTRSGSTTGNGGDGSSPMSPQASSPSAFRSPFRLSGGGSKKRLSRHAEEELDLSNRRIGGLETDLARLVARCTEIDLKILHHHVGLLALTHSGSHSSSALAVDAYARQLNMTNGGTRHSQQIAAADAPTEVVGGPHGGHGHGHGHGMANATSRMISQRFSGSLGSSTSAGSNGGSNDDESDATVVDSIITMMTSSLASPTMSPRPAPTHEKLPFLSSLTQSLVSQYDNAKAQLATRDAQNEELRAIVHETVADLSPSTAATMDPAAEVSDLRGVVERSVSDFKSTHAGGSATSSGTRGLGNASVGATAAAAAAGLTGAVSGAHFEEGENTKAKTLLKQQLESLNSAYGASCAELERMENENVEIKDKLREARFKADAESQQLRNELRANQEREAEWKERCDTLRIELESVVRSLEDVTRQSVEYESERAQLEAKVEELQKRLFKDSQKSLDNRLSQLQLGTGSPASARGGSRNSARNSTRAMNEPNGTMGAEDLLDHPDEPSSVMILRHEFRKIIMDMNNKHQREIRREQKETRRLENLLKSIKRSSYVANLPPAKLESLGLS